MNVFDVLGNYKMPVVNVLDYGAVGDGSTDDAAALQTAIDAVNGGGVVYFPCRVYSIQTSLYMYSNQVLFFEPEATIKQGASINNLLRTYADSTITGYNGMHDIVVYGATFDGGTYSTNNTLVGTVHSKNITFEMCTFKNAYGTWHDLEINSSYNVKVINCDFEGTRKTGSNGEMLQIDGAGSASYYPWDNINIDNTVSEYIDIVGCIFHDSTNGPGIGNHSNMAHKFVRVHDCIFDNITASRGAINFVSNMTDIDLYSNTFNNCTTAIGTDGTTYYIHDNRFVGVTTAIYGSNSVAHSNIINGTYTA